MGVEVLWLAGGVALGLLLAAVLLSGRVAEAVRSALAERMEGLDRAQGRVEAALRAELSAGRAEAASAAGALRQELTAGLDRAAGTLDGRLGLLLAENARRLEEMRRTVDERLQGTLERRLGESFRLVGDRLEAVQRGLGEMQALASGVGDLKKVLANVKVRGTWGEIQLGQLLAQLLAPEQFAVNVATRPRTAERVEFAVRLPGAVPGEEVLLPIDSKFPLEDHARLVEASERGDAAAVEASAQALEARVRACAADVAEKYLNPPYTTDFGVLFLPTEGLYAEVVRRPGLLEALQREHRVVVAGPSTLAALLNSLQMGFRTLAIQRRSSEVWAVLGAVKAEFARFGEVVGAVEKKLQEATNKLAQVGTRTRAIERELRAVQALPAPEVVPPAPPPGAPEPDEDAGYVSRA